MNDFSKRNTWNYLNQINHKSSASWEVFGGIPTVLLMGAVFLLWAVLLSGCETVGETFQSAAGPCLRVENLTSSEYVVISSLGTGSRKEISYGESKTHNVFLSGDQDEVDMTIAILRGGETLTTESDEVWFDEDKSGCELISVSLENQGGFNIGGL